MVEIQCTQCKAFIARYKGSGELDLLLLEKVIKPTFLKDMGYSEKDDLPLQICHECGNKLGKPTISAKGQFAYKMIKGSFRKKGDIKAMTPSPHTSWR